MIGKAEEAPQLEVVSRATLHKQPNALAWRSSTEHGILLRVLASRKM
jgi:hypothetical protein